MKTLKTPSNDSRRSGISGQAAWVAFWAYSVFILINAVLPERYYSFLAHVNDKFLHGLEFFLLFGFAGNAFFYARSETFRRHTCLFAWLYCAAFGALSEAVQFFTPDRTPDWKDWLADVTGAAVGILLYLLLNQFRSASVLDKLEQ